MLFSEKINPKIDRDVNFPATHAWQAPPDSLAERRAPPQQTTRRHFPMPGQGTPNPCLPRNPAGRPPPPAGRRSFLLRVQTVADLRGVPEKRVIELADVHYTWVWNVGSGEHRRALRFWNQEVLNPAATADLCLSQVIGRLLPRTVLLPGQFDGWRGDQVIALLRIHRSILQDLRAELDGVERFGTLCIPRAGLENFLRRRWLLADVPRWKA